VEHCVATGSYVFVLKLQRAYCNVIHVLTDSSKERIRWSLNVLTHHAWFCVHIQIQMHIHIWSTFIMNVGAHSTL
jgi:hypothetical protein